jgi:hypothetical protein
LHCSQKLLHKDKRTIVYRTLFGKLHLQCPRLFHCSCQEQATRSFNPVSNLLPERTSRELLYLESKYGSLMSYGLSAKLLQEVLPIEGEINTTAIRNNLHRIGQRLEDELGEEKGGYIEGFLCLCANPTLERKLVKLVHIPKVFRGLSYDSTNRPTIESW